MIRALVTAKLYAVAGVHYILKEVVPIGEKITFLRI